MSSSHKYVLFVYFILLMVAIACFGSLAHAEEDPTAAISIMDSGMGVEVVEITCHGQTFSTNVPKIKLASSLKELEAYVDENCNRGKK